MQEIIDALEGEQIKEIFKNAKKVANLHLIITSPRGKFFRLNLLQHLGEAKPHSELNLLRQKHDMGELQRHLNMFCELNLISIEGDEHYERTDQGERLVNAIRRLETRIGEEAAEKIFQSSLGTNSIRIFLRLFGKNKEPDLETLKIKYTPSELGQLCLFLTRNIEGIAAIDKLNDADLLVYEEDGNYIYQDPRKVRSFYQYLCKLYQLVKHET